MKELLLFWEEMFWHQGQLQLYLRFVLCTAWHLDCHRLVRSLHEEECLRRIVVRWAELAQTWMYPRENKSFQLSSHNCVFLDGLTWTSGSMTISVFHFKRTQHATLLRWQPSAFIKDLNICLIKLCWARERTAWIGARKREVVEICTNK